MHYNEFPDGIQWPAESIDTTNIYNDVNMMIALERAQHYDLNAEMCAGDYTHASDPFARLRTAIGHRVFMICDTIPHDYSEESLLLSGIKMAEVGGEHALVVELPDLSTVQVPFRDIRQFIDEDCPPDARVESLLEQCIPDATNAVYECVRQATLSQDITDSDDLSVINHTVFLGELTDRLESFSYKTEKTHMTDYEERFLGRSMEYYLAMFVEPGQSLCLLERGEGQKYLQCVTKAIVVNTCKEKQTLEIGVHVASTDGSLPRERVVWLHDVGDFLDTPTERQD